MTEASDDISNNDAQLITSFEQMIKQLSGERA
jgi:hypothetical protein